MQITKTLPSSGSTTLKPSAAGESAPPTRAANEDSFQPTTPEDKLSQLQLQLSHLRSQRNENFKEAAWRIGGGLGTIVAFAETARQLSGAAPFSEEVVKMTPLGGVAALAMTVAVQLVFDPLGGVFAAGRGVADAVDIQLTKSDINKLSERD